jgi:monovalent cation/hydrogen antiporter
VRKEFKAQLTNDGTEGGASAWRSAHGEIRRSAIQAARRAVLAMRANDEIGDDAFHRIEEELDWLEMADGRRGEQ